MTVAVLTLHFGEPREATAEAVRPYLERIFLANAELEPGTSDEAARRRSRELAEHRLDGLLEEYEEIGGSPLNDQARAQTRALEDVLRGRGVEARAYAGMQFTPPFIADALARARDDGAELLVGLPVYPLCGRSTTLAALDTLDRALEDAGWEVETSHVSGWHRHPAYLDLRADAIRRLCEERDVDLRDPGVELVFSAHGTPVMYLEDGGRYDRYVREYCREVSRRLGGPSWVLGFQNHGNRPVEWTQPEVDEVVAGSDARELVVDPVSFMHEQSETLAELDVDLREVAEAAGRSFHRVPVPHDDPVFAEILADLVSAAAARAGVEFPEAASAVEFPTRRCRCRSAEDTFCLNVA